MTAAVQNLAGSSTRFDFAPASWTAAALPLSTANSHFASVFGDGPAPGPFCYCVISNR